MTSNDAFSSLVRAQDIRVEHLDQAHDFLRLIGIVMAQVTLLDVLASPETSAREKVSASRILLDTVKESPEAIAERLRRSPFAHLSVEELRALAERVTSGETLAESLDHLRTALGD